MILSHHSLDGFMNTVKNILVMLHKVSSVDIVLRVDGAVGVSTTSFVWLALRTTKNFAFCKLLYSIKRAYSKLCHVNAFICKQKCLKTKVFTKCLKNQASSILLRW